MSEKFVCVKIDTFRQAKPIQRFKVKEYKAYFILQDNTGRELHRQESPRSLSPLEKWMKAHARLSKEDRKSYLRFVAGYGKIPDKTRERIADLTDQLGDAGMVEREKATQELIEMGYPAYAVLSKRKKIRDAEVQARVTTIVKTLDRWNQRLTRDKERNIPFLIRLLENDDADVRKEAEKTLRRILPIPTPDSWKDLETWWEENRNRYAWNSASKKYVPNR